jgi:TonB family protein
MRVAIAVLIVVGCKAQKIDKADKLEPPQPELSITPAPEPPPPPPPLDTHWMLIADVPDPSLQNALGELLRPFSPAISICVVLDARGAIYATRAHDEAGARITDDKVLADLEALHRARKLQLRDETAQAVGGKWLCTRAPGAAPPRTVPPTQLEARRIAGDKNIVPDDATRSEIQRAGKERIVTSWKLCIDETGAATEVKVLKPSGFAAYDAKIERAMKAWKYQPFEAPVGRVVPVCTAVTFIYAER